MRRPGCDNCLIRNILFEDHFKNGIVKAKVFKDADVEGISLTATSSYIRGLDDLEDYIVAISQDRNFRLGVAVMEAEQCTSIGITWRPDPHNEHRYGHLHVLGPTPDQMISELRNECARLANLTGWSRGPIQQVP